MGKILEEHSHICGGFRLHTFCICENGFKMQLILETTMSCLEKSRPTNVCVSTWLKFYIT